MAKTILITGASSGIGKATAHHFANKGWNVVATMRKPQDGVEFESLDNVLVTELDVTKSDTIKNSIAQAKQQFGTIDVLVNNAGYANGGALEAIPMENLRRQFDVNVIGLLETIKEVVPTMREQKSGTIVNISSIGGRITMPFFAPYHGTKWAVEGITESLQYELNPLGINLKLVEPGAVNTDFAGRSLDFKNDENLGEYQEPLGKFMGALSKASEAASAPEMVAQVIDDAIHGDELRYLAGPDAEAMMGARNQLNDKEILNNFQEFFGLK